MPRLMMRVDDRKRLMLKRKKLSEKRLKRIKKKWRNKFSEGLKNG